MLYVAGVITPELVAYGLGTFAMRDYLFDAKDDVTSGIGFGGYENQLRAGLGARYTVDDIEIHLDYDFTNNDSGEFTTYQRHRVGLGVRYWYQ